VKEQEMNAQQTRIKLLKDKLFKETQGVHNTKNEETKLKNEISGAKSISKNLEFQLNLLDKEASRQQELLYNAEFQIQQIERKVIYIYICVCVCMYKFIHIYKCMYTYFYMNTHVHIYIYIHKYSYKFIFLRKVTRGMGERSDEEKRQLRAQIADSEASLEKAKDKRKMLHTQSRKLQNELAALKIARYL
jgi:chromosome segregation ATPase